MAGDTGMEVTSRADLLASRFLRRPPKKEGLAKIIFQKSHTLQAWLESSVAVDP